MLELMTGIIVAIAAVGLVLEPLVRRNVAPGLGRAEAAIGEFVELEESGSEKVQALLALREIEFDRATGKLSDEDYTVLKQRYARAAVEAMKAEDDSVAASHAPAAATDAAEREIARLRARGPGSCPTCGVRPEPGAVFCSRCGRSVVVPDTRPRCWMCGSDLVENAKFCGECGFDLSA